MRYLDGCTSPHLSFYRTPTNTHRMPGGMLLEHECDDTKAVGGLVWIEGAKPGAFLSVLCLGTVHRDFFRALCIWDHRMHDDWSADTGHH